ncbi:MAG: hypothetical protein GY813_03170 [Halieaceae bacterium]|nr:hypothetical protein [Halieaceae bacterium]
MYSSSSTDSSDIGGLSRSHDLLEAYHNGVRQRGIQGSAEIPTCLGLLRRHGSPGIAQPYQDSSIGFGYVP